MKHFSLNKAGSIILALVISFPLLLGLAGKAKAEEYDTNRFVEITVHAGTEGYFDGDTTVHEKKTLQFKGYVFDFSEKPESDTLVFQGWANTPDATKPDVTPGETAVKDIGTDVYAVWADKIKVTYRGQDGVVVVNGQEYMDYDIIYKVGDAFQSLETRAGDDRIAFTGWNTGQSGNDTEYVDGQPVGSKNFTVYAQWRLIEEKIPKIELDVDYTIDVVNAGMYYSFTPEESDVYAIRADLPAREGVTSAYVQWIDTELKTLDTSNYNADGNAVLTVSLEAGETYYFQIRESAGYDATIAFRLEKANYKTVTFHANHEGAYFDGDEKCTEKQYKFAVGTSLKYFEPTGLQVDAPDCKQIGWSPNSEDDLPAEGFEPYEVVDNMDLYAIYQEFDSITLDANGGTFPTENGETMTIFYYHVSPDSLPFYTTTTPRSADPTKIFLGWATTSDAETADIPEDVIPAYDLRGKTLYAVYTEKVLITFDANGGHLFMPTGPGTYSTIVAKGSKLAGITAINDDITLVPYAYVDQDGVEIAYSKDLYELDYIIEKDSYFTVQWGVEVYLHANGGYFASTGEKYLVTIQDKDGVFSLEKYRDEIAGLVNPDYSQYLAGWGSNPGVEEPNIFEGVTPVKDLLQIDSLPAIWLTDTYYFEEGENGTWEKGSKDGFRAVIKREHDDSNTYPSYAYADPSGILIDENEVEAEGNYTAEEGSLILTLQPAYLETLSVGEHTLAINFKDSDPVTTTFTITEPTAPSDDTPADTSPKTGDPNNAILWICLAAGALVIIAGVLVVLRKGAKNRQ